LKKIIVNTNQSSYPVFIGSSNLDSITANLEKLDLFNNLFIVIDKNVAKYHLTKIKTVLKYHSGKISYYILPSGEKTKSERELGKIYNALLKDNFGRDTTLIAIGGGVTGDIAGFAAATFMRGIQLVHIPTTLLAMIDSSIGGKTGINFSTKKNIIGSFYQPKLVLIDTYFLSTLPVRELNSAMGELIKYALIANKTLFNFLSENLKEIISLNNTYIRKAIVESVLIKGGVVSQDEFELKGIRKILNFGHTFAHAIETDLGFRIKHGEAVAAGIICALFLSNKLGILNSSKLKTTLQLSGKIKLPLIINKIDNQNIFKAMQSDKKNRDDKIMFVLISDIGKVLVDVPANKKDVFYAISKMKDFGFV
jgi:3-dehydroquinate synthase